MKGIVLHRELAPGVYPLRRVVEGLDSSPPLCHLFGGEDACASALDRARVAIEEEDGFMWVDDEEGVLHVARSWWRTGEEMHIYLDLVHELVHVKQFWEGRDLYDRNYRYIERPTELEAYRVVVEEARRLGMNEPDLVDFLKVPWITSEEHRRLCRTLGVSPPSPA